MRCFNLPTRGGRTKETTSNIKSHYILLQIYHDGKKTKTKKKYVLQPTNSLPTTISIFQAQSRSKDETMDKSKPRTSTFINIQKQIDQLHISMKSVIDVNKWTYKLETSTFRQQRKLIGN